jgi:flagellar hook-associated protein FlgK
MTVDNFTPQIWSARILSNLNDSHVYIQGTNRDYEGEIKNLGDSVRINSVGRITISSYTKNSTSLTPETVDGAGQVLVITQAESFAFQIDDVDNAQTKPKLMNEYMREAAWGLSDVADNFVAVLMAAGVSTTNTLTAATTVGTGATDDDAYDILVDIDTALTVSNTPSGGRWVVIPPWYHGVLRKDPRFVSFGTDQNRSNLRGEPIGQVANLTVRVSNNVPLSSSTYTLIAGYDGATAFAEQIPEGNPEAYRPEAKFADAMKGLHLYGAQVTRPDNLVKIAVTEAT